MYTCASWKLRSSPKSILVIAVVAAVLLAAGGCPQTRPEDSSSSADPTPQAQAPAAVEQSEGVTLGVQLADGVDPSSVTYRWFQVFGRAVVIRNADTADASFVAPSLAKDQTLRFRVDVRTSDGTIYSDTVEVTITRDDNYVIVDDSDPNSTGKIPYPRVRLVTNKGNIVLELDRGNAPLSVNNFMRYVNDGFYDNTIFHRIVRRDESGEGIAVLQGGGFEPGLEQKTPRSSIRNESDNGLTNSRGTISMARQSDLDSATSQFFINVEDNDALNPSPGTNDGYAVYGRVVEGMNVVDDIGAVETESRDGMDDVPVDDVVLEEAVEIISPTDDSPLSPG